MEEYQLIDSGDGEKLEQFGPHRICRPASQAVWRKSKKWSFDARFTRNEDGWEGHLPRQWTIKVSEVEFLLSPTDFGHLGIFPEQAPMWQWLQSECQGLSLLNLFAYSGGVTLAAAKGGATVCHLDASKGMVEWARENARLNKLDNNPIRWIVDDVFKFLRREIKRGRRYDAIVLDPPTFGRGAAGEVFKIERDIQELLGLCKAVLSDNPKFVVFSCHTPGFTPICLENLLKQMMGKGQIDSGEMAIDNLPSGAFARWTR